MRKVLTILIVMHGVIHLLGFLNAFVMFDFNIISHPVTKTFGMLWVLSFALFTCTAVLLIAQSNYWWFIGIVGVVLSQFLIINYWSDAKLGTMANVIILLAAIVGYSKFSFREKIRGERLTQFENSQPKSQDVVSEESLLDLPPVVRKWLINSGIVGKKFISHAYLSQGLQLKLRPGQATWSNGTAEQYFTVQPPAFNWDISTEMYSILSVAGRDKFEDGKGEMSIKLLSLIPVANEINNVKVNQASLQRYLAEIVWIPSASLSQYIKWESIDEYSARATIEYKGTKGSGVFYFDIDGKFEKFVAMRYLDSNDSEPTEWTVTATKTEERNEIQIPVECEASWELESGKWTWLKLVIIDIQYNMDKMPVFNNVCRK